MSENVLSAEARTGTGKGVARKLRAAGRIPAVVYGKGLEARAIHVDPVLLDKLLHSSGAGLNTLIDLDLEGSSEKVLLKSLQREPVNGAFLHADFHQVDLSQTVTVSVPLHFVGRPRGVELDGGLLDHPVREIELECLPTAIPESIEVDVSGIGLNEALHVSDLVLPPDTEIKTDSALAVATVSPPKAEEEEAEAAEGEEGAEEGAEPAADAGGEAPAEKSDGGGD